MLGFAGLLLWTALDPRPGLAAGDEGWILRHYGSADGLPVGSALASHSDGDGFLWVATYDGLARFDGSQFEIYDASRVAGMSSNRISRLYRHESGWLYALTHAGELLMARANRVEHANLQPGFATTPVRFVDPVSLCATTAAGMYCPDDLGQFRLRLPFDVDVAAALPLSTQQTWLLIPDQGIDLQTGEERRRVWPAPDLHLGPARFPHALTTSDGSLLVDFRQGLLLLGKDASSRMLFERSRQPVDLLRLSRDSNTGIWIASTLGLHRFDGGDLSLQRHAAEGTDKVRLFGQRAPDGSSWESDGGRLYRDDVLILSSPGIIEHVCFDVPDMVWVSTERDGLYALSRPRVARIGLEHGLPGDNVYGVDVDRDGNLWAGTLGGSVLRLDVRGQVHSYGRQHGLPNADVWAVAAAADGTIYAAPYAHGLYRLGSEREHFEPVALPEALASSQISALVFDSRQRLWLGTSNGVWRLDLDGWRRIWPDQAMARVRSILPGDTDDVWFGTEDGLWRRVGNQAHPVAPALLSGVAVRHLFRTRDGTVWASTEGHGLIRIGTDDPDGRSALVLGRAQGLPSNSPHALHEDGHGHLWINSNQGVFRLLSEDLAAFVAGTGDRLSPLVLGRTDGLTELEGNGAVQPAAGLDHDGRLWFPSQHGLLRVDLGRIHIRSHPPTPVIDRVLADGDLVPHADLASLPLGLRSLQVRYDAADLHNGHQLRFRHRLLPVQQRWTDAGNRRAASLIALAPGRYRFELIASNSDGYWSTTPAVLEFGVPEHWHETSGFRLAGLAGLLLLVLFAANLRVRSLHRHAARLDAQVEQRTLELRLAKERAEHVSIELADANAALAAKNDLIEHSNRRLAEQADRLEALDGFRARLLADISHELRTPLMLIGMPLRELLGNEAALTEDERRHLELSLKQTERLSGLVEQLVDLVQAESGQLRLSLHRVDLAAFLDGLVRDFAPLAAVNEVSVRVQHDRAASVLFADQAKLATALGNLIDNAIKFAPAGSEVTVYCRTLTHKEQLRIEVQDRGPGFDPECANKLFERFHRGTQPTRTAARRSLGIGLALARELVELHGGRIGAESTPGQGACFWISLPLDDAHLGSDEADVADPAERCMFAADTSSTPRRTGNGLGRILLVEDESDLANYLRERLVGYLHVELAGDADSALSRLRQEHFDLVISDVVLPGRSGIDLCRLIRTDAELAQLPVLLTSAKANERDREAGLNAGGQDYLVKPFDFPTLLTSIARACPKAGALFDGHHDRHVEGTLDPLLATALSSLGEAKFDVGVWADRCHLSERQLRRRVQEITGQPPVTWLREQRLQLTRRLISSGECRTLAEAGIRAGIDNPSYLYRLYRSRFGDLDD